MNFVGFRMVLIVLLNQLCRICPGGRDPAQIKLLLVCSGLRATGARKRQSR